MTEEINKILNDPNFAVEFAVGEPFATLEPADRTTGIQVSRIYHDTVKRYILKSAHMSRDDVRVFDSDTGRVVLAGHYPGKNPYEMVDPLGLTNQGKRFEMPVIGGEWQSLYDITGMNSFPSLRIRPKWLSRHGRQLVYLGDQEVLNVGKVGRFKTMSLRDHFTVTSPTSSTSYTCVADMTGRSIAIRDNEERLIAQVCKTTKAVILNAAFGAGSESTIDIAPGVDCSTILAIVFGLRQVGQHFISDAFDNYVADPAKDAMVDSVVDAAGLGSAVDGYTQVSNSTFNMMGSLTQKARYVYHNFF